MKTILLVVSVAAFLSACSDFGENPGEVYAVVDIQTIAITNTTKQPVHVLVMGGSIAMIANWTPFAIQIASSRLVRLQHMIIPT